MPLSSDQRGTRDSPLSSGQGAVQHQHPGPLSSGQGATHNSQDRSSLSSGQGIAEYTEQGNSYQGTGFAHGLPTAASTLSGPKASQQAGTLSSGQVNSCPTNPVGCYRPSSARLFEQPVHRLVTQHLLVTHHLLVTRHLWVAWHRLVTWYLLVIWRHSLPLLQCNRPAYKQQINWQVSHQPRQARPTHPRYP